MAQKNIISINGQDVKNITCYPDKKFDGSGLNGHNYGRILSDFVKKSEVPISIGFFNANKQEVNDKFSQYMPLVSNFHLSYAPVGISFKDANKEFGSRYDGYHVSVDVETGEKILLKLPVGKVLLADAVKPKNEWTEVDVWNLVNHILSLELGIENNKPNISYRYDKKENAHVVEPAQGTVVAAPLSIEGRGYKLKNGVLVQSDLPDPSANIIDWDLSINFNGLIGLGDFCTLGVDLGGRQLKTHLQPSTRLDVLAQV